MPFFKLYDSNIMTALLNNFSLKLYYNQGECLVLKPISGEMEELQEILMRLAAVTPGCEVRHSKLQIRGDIQDNSKITFLISQRKHMM